MITGGVDEAINRSHREEWGRVLGALAKRFGDLDVAEEATADAFAVAVVRWPLDGVPPNPGAWLTTTATRKALDRLRREQRRDGKQREALMPHDDEVHDPGALDDDRLRLLFTCCHPSLGIEARVALTLRLVAGLSVDEIARAFLVPVTTVAQRVTRAKSKIKSARVPYRMPDIEELPARLGAVLAVLYLLYNEGYLATKDTPLRPALTDEALRLTRLLHELLPNDGETTGLLALMLLSEARRGARVTSSGDLVLLHDQDRTTWDHELVAEGHRLVRERLATKTAPGRYQVLAAINAVHTDAAVAGDTDWSQIVALYDQLIALDPSPVVALNRAVALAELDGPEVALPIVERLAAVLEPYVYLHAVRADLLRRLRRDAEARSSYDRALRLTTNDAERAFLIERRDELASS